ncbi:hypothetical protein [Thermomonospora umbrina]|uniref:Uncharacterized protein n=1 Tax=Thermomonospora umbrina TaxID=111806 RepID=A0A3D9SVW2_9ACTN|nr:hypothetical protein [Thermomonospora umbrina]REE97125.1 hypothetical protein DFJ69_2581 [Thermomonospora umbrina]
MGEGPEFFVWEVRDEGDGLGPVGVAGSPLDASAAVVGMLVRKPVGWSGSVARVRLDPWRPERYEVLQTVVWGTGRLAGRADGLQQE